MKDTGLLIIMGLFTTLTVIGALVIGNAMFLKSGLKSHDDITAEIVQKDSLDENYYIYTAAGFAYICTENVYSEVQVGGVYILKFDNSNKTISMIVIEAVRE